jgi:hypothetical protein
VAAELGGTVNVFSWAIVANLDCICFPVGTAAGEANLDSDILITEGFWAVTMRDISVQLSRRNSGEVEEHTAPQRLLSHLLGQHCVYSSRSTLESSIRDVGIVNKNSQLEILRRGSSVRDHETRTGNLGLRKQPVAIYI